MANDWPVAVAGGGRVVCLAAVLNGQTWPPRDLFAGEMTMKLNRMALVWLVFLLAASGKYALGQDIHFLLVADTGDASLGRCCSITVERVTGTLSYLIPRQRYTLRTLESGRGDYGNADSVLRAVRDVEVPRGDTFVFFYHGHGGASGDRHFLHMPDGGRLYSSDLKATVQAKSCRLAVIMTCSCNVPVRGVGEAARQRKAGTSRPRAWHR